MSIIAGGGPWWEFPSDGRFAGETGERLSGEAGRGACWRLEEGEESLKHHPVEWEGEGCLEGSCGPRQHL